VFNPNVYVIRHLWKRHLKNVNRSLCADSADNEHTGNIMAWFYEIRDANKAVAATGKGYATQNAAMAAGRKKARELKASGSLPSGGVATIKAWQRTEVPDLRKG
jgi:hypothetical protein